MFETPAIPGADDVVAWFGYWPNFHDAEVVSINLDRRTGCRVVVHAFASTSEVDDRGHYVHEKHALVTFVLEGFPFDPTGKDTIRIESFNHQNVLSSLSVNKKPDGFELMLEGCYGVDGVISATRIRVELTPGIPEGSQYRKDGSAVSE